MCEAPQLRKYNGKKDRRKKENQPCYYTTETNRIKRIERKTGRHKHLNAHTLTTAYHTSCWKVKMKLTGYMLIYFLEC